MSVIDDIADLNVRTSLQGLLDGRSREQIDNPQWDKAGRVHDWRNHVPYLIKDAWAFLSLETRIVVFAMAEEKANDEEWD